ncbi:MAG: glycoside hydrolase family 127 protein [Prolixibacteraceae bacterium]|nr:glycoside hydrolase family 127 protein [Prolixibacteraceae bacterium]MBN2774754.1 glycoside hydrolase family 127 protein [Prolixibacteraceae bacterium]
MKKYFYCLPILLFILFSCQEKEETKDYPILPVDRNNIELIDSFWNSRIETNTEVTIPYCFNKCEETHRIANFEVAGGLIEGTHFGKRYNDSDVYKIMEGAAYSLQQNYDPELDKYLDDLISKIAAAQEDDGYLYTIRTIKPDSLTEYEGFERWEKVRMHSHELYNVGHMYEAAVAHYQATGKTTFLNIALKNAELIASVYGPDKRHDAPGHQEIEIGLAKLYRVTGDKKYLDLAKFFLDERGKSDIRDYNSESIWENGAYWQDHKPVVEQDEAVGHAVRAVYMYSAMADVAALTGDEKYLEAIKKIWENVVSKKYYITGGIGAEYDGEAFGDNYELPNRAYNETCAAIANVFWNHRMFLMTGESKYIDVLERTLYNGMLSGISLEGNTFFYPNVLEFDGHDPFNQGATSRKPWFDCSCCPSNIARFIPAVPGYLYAVKDNQIYANLFASNKAELSVNDKFVYIIQETKYPWEGTVNFEVQVEKPTQFTLNLRIPGWALNQPVPSDLYTYINETAKQYVVKVNGEVISTGIKNGYFPIQRKWEQGDVVELELPIQIKKVIPHKNVKEIAGKVAVERGPVVYCAEQADNPDGVLHLSVSDNENFKPEFVNELKGIVKLTSESGLTLIPYYAWSHREPGEMEVWFKREE